MPKVDVWMPIYIGDYIADTMRLTTEQHGAYLLMLMEQWMTGPLPDDNEELAAITKMGLDRWISIRPKLSRFFVIEGGTWTQMRLQREKEIAEGRRESASKNGKKGGRPKAKNNPRVNPQETGSLTTGKPTGNPKRNPQKTSSPSPSPIEPNGSIKPLCPAKPDAELVAKANSIIDNLNITAGKKFRHTVANRKFITARLNDGHTVDDCLAVIERQTQKWRGGEMDKYLRPETLFNATKFESYLNDKGVNHANAQGHTLPDPNERGISGAERTRRARELRRQQERGDIH